MYDIVLECKDVHHWFGKNKVLYDIDFQIVRGEIVALVGPSGCGKSTLLRAILGTHPPRSGQILMNGQPVVSPGRDRGIVYQRYSLYPFLTAVENVAFGLMLDQTSLAYRSFQCWKWRSLRTAHLQQAAEMLERVGLERAMRLYPTQMSGGMCQRVALAQALIMKPQILLLDEPFGALDEATREDLQQMLLQLYDENVQAKQAGKEPPYTILIVTHELNEAIYVSDRVAALSQYWRWEDDNLAAPPGATLVYDAVVPVIKSEVEAPLQEFRQQRAEIREAAFEPSKRHPRGAYLRFWKECEQGRGQGVLQA